MSAGALAVQVRLRRRWAEAALAETEEMAAAEKTAKQADEDVWQALLKALGELFAPLERPWQNYLSLLEAGTPHTAVASATVESLRNLIHSAKAIHGVLLDHTAKDRPELQRAGEVIARFDREVSAVAAAMRFPPFDPDRLRLGAEQAAQGEAEDVESILARFSAVSEK